MWERRLSWEGFSEFVLLNDRSLQHMRLVTLYYDSHRLKLVEKYRKPPCSQEVALRRCVGVWERHSWEGCR